MANKTNNYKFPKPEADDFYDISEYNKAMDILDDSLSEMDKKKLDKNGDASEAVTEFEQEILRENIESGETLSVIHGKVKKWFSEMKDVVFSGHAKDLTTDAAHRFVSDTEKSSWNGKVGASGGDISETVINYLENIKEKYPIPEVGESTKVFTGKVKKFIENIKPLDADIIVYVDTSGDDTTGNGTSAKPFKTIQHAVDFLPKNLGSVTATLIVGNGTYNEDLIINGFTNGKLLVKSTGDSVDNAVNIRSIHAYHCLCDLCIWAVTITETTSQNAVSVDVVSSLTLRYVSIVSSNILKTCVIVRESIVTIQDCSLSNHAYAIYAHHNSKIFSINNTGSGNNSAVVGVDGSIVSTSGVQPIGIYSNKDYQSGSIIVSNHGAVIGTLKDDTTIYVATTGSDITGDGTGLKPFKTIQYAVNTLPKDLGSRGVNVLIADGTYIENVIISGFYNGALDIKSQSSPDALNALCTIKRVITINCTARMQFFGINFIETQEESAFRAQDCRYVRVMFCQTLRSTTYGFDFIYCDNVIAHGCLNKNSEYSVRVYVSNLLSIGWASTSLANRYGLTCDGGTIKKVGFQPAGVLGPILSLTGGVITNDSGTQISEITSYGLSCAWGTINSGYYRKGNLNGTAEINVQINIQTTVPLSANTPYAISGFPLRRDVYDTVISTAIPSRTSLCYLRNIGGYSEIYYVPSVDITTGSWLLFGGSYITNS